ncbi:hypothetical protein [Halorarius halobius]|uniref:hypothetical protein n=1 Tax=Halorarius halobius TaxID=2962671 RepID=UPI0020CFA554|nr:hypothetical protein [Halorarius halobius]
MRAAAVALLVAVLLVLAGCNAVVSGPATPTARTTAAPVPDADAYPPGVGADGVSDAVALANAHAAAAGDRYVVASNYTVRYANGTLRASVRQRSRVESERWRARVAVDGPRPSVVSRDPATAVFYSNGATLVERIRRESGTSYLYVPADEFNGGNGFYNSLRRPKPYRDPWALLSSLDVRTQAANGSAVLVADALAEPSLFAAVAEVQAPRNVSYSATVGASGLLRTQRLTYAGEMFGTSVRVSRTIRYRSLDASVERPDWYATAVNRSVRG